MLNRLNSTWTFPWCSGVKTQGTYVTKQPTKPQDGRHQTQRCGRQKKRPGPRKTRWGQMKNSKSQIRAVVQRNILYNSLAVKKAQAQNIPWKPMYVSFPSTWRIYHGDGERLFVGNLWGAVPSFVKLFMPGHTKSSMGKSIKEMEDATVV